MKKLDSGCLMVSARHVRLQLRGALAAATGALISCIPSSLSDLGRSPMSGAAATRSRYIHPPVKPA
jgi:hypothetical protein